LNGAHRRERYGFDNKLTTNGIVDNGWRCRLLSKQSSGTLYLAFQYRGNDTLAPGVVLWREQ